MGNYVLAFDPDAALKALRRDPALRPLLRRCGPFTLEVRRDVSPFEALARSIVFQQLNGKVAAKIFDRLKGLFGNAHLRPEDILASEDATLRGAGLSAAKTTAIRDLSLKTVEGLVLDWRGLKRLDDEEIIDRFIQVRGIGRWTVEMMLMFRLGRPDVWPVDDFAIRKAYGLLFEIEKPGIREMRERAEAWRPYRSVVAWYLYRSLDTD